MNYIELDGWRTIKNDICLKSAKKQGMGQIEEYQNLELQTAISHCSKLRIAVDIGAHVGITAYRLSESFESVTGTTNERDRALPEGIRNNKY